jgi:DNA-binding MarR family transcriptional regulator/GNAT superfamily N-acetyltransferase
MDATKVGNVEVVEEIRNFNRFYTRKIGVLNEGLLGSSFSLTEARVLYDLAHRANATANDLVKELGLDPGYLSRMLARFVSRRLIKRERSRKDGRQTYLRLSAVGRKTFGELNRRSAQQMNELVRHLPLPEQKRLVRLTRSVRDLLSPAEATVHTVALRDPKSGDLGWVVQRHGEIYAEEYSWDLRFEALVARIITDYVERLEPKRDRCWIAECEGERVGCVFLVGKTKTVAKLRLLLVEPSARGRGVGQRLVAAAIDFARAAGYLKIVLWTNSILHTARRIYEHEGFRLVRSEAHHSFGQDLVGETWELALKLSVSEQ